MALGAAVGPAENWTVAVPGRGGRPVPRGMVTRTCLELLGKLNLPCPLSVTVPGDWVMVGASTTKEAGVAGGGAAVLEEVAAHAHGGPDAVHVDAQFQLNSGAGTTVAAAYQAFHGLGRGPERGVRLQLRHPGLELYGLLTALEFRGRGHLLELCHLLPRGQVLEVDLQR